ncbi:hypothetical protein L6452_29313 [Arctium lappa]|uniref:Uncharacterized protein n=1 Tax=Arctium lappa TaxID=4217 RepID=A0ACB8ZFP8_ARCLA|nr:hypothetical protein L6452_29313 [Arctium lappa]
MLQREIKTFLGVDPKSILCEFYKTGQCAKGFKCKFSHDLDIQRKGEKIDLYSDRHERNEEVGHDDDNLCVTFKNGKSLKTGTLNSYDSSCQIGIDKRAKITTSTPMTPELFMQWKKKKKNEQRDAGLAAKRAERAKNDRMSGCELFLSDSTLFVDDAEAYERYQREEEYHTKKKAHQFYDDDEVSKNDDKNPSSDDDDNDLEIDELNELEASLSRASIQNKDAGPST